jgi:hypothetical protein
MAQLSPIPGAGLSKQSGHRLKEEVESTEDPAANLARHWEEDHKIRI